MYNCNPLVLSCSHCLWAQAEQSCVMLIRFLSLAQMKRKPNNKLHSLLSRWLCVIGVCGVTIMCDRSIAFPLFKSHYVETPNITCWEWLLFDSDVKEGVMPSVAFLWCLNRDPRWGCWWCRCQIMIVCGKSKIGCGSVSKITHHCIFLQFLQCLLRKTERKCIKMEMKSLHDPGLSNFHMCWHLHSNYYIFLETNVLFTDSHRSYVVYIFL